MRVKSPLCLLLPLRKREGRGLVLLHVPTLDNCATPSTSNLLLSIFSVINAIFGIKPRIVSQKSSRHHVNTNASPVIQVISFQQHGCSPPTKNENKLVCLLSPPNQPRRRQPITARCWLSFGEPPQIDLMEGRSDDESSIEPAEFTKQSFSACNIEQLLSIIATQRKINERLHFEKFDREADILELKKIVIVRTRTIWHLHQILDATTNPNKGTPINADNSDDETDEPCSPAVRSGRKNP
jgi:hypothetical protein